MSGVKQEFAQKSLGIGWVKNFHSFNSSEYRGCFQTRFKRKNSVNSYKGIGQEGKGPLVNWFWNGKHHCDAGRCGDGGLAYDVSKSVFLHWFFYNLESFSRRKNPIQIKHKLWAIIWNEF